MMSLTPVDYVPQDVADEALVIIQDAVSAAAEEGEVLFMDQRQLLTFGYVENVPLVPEYEKKVVMNAAMADDEAYFGAFYDDLARGRFALIVNEPGVIKYQGDAFEFGDENDAWVRWVTVPLFCYYEVKETLRDVGAELLVPREVPLTGEGCPSS